MSVHLLLNVRLNVSGVISSTRALLATNVSMARSAGELVGVAEGCAALEVPAVAPAYPRGVLVAEADRLDFVA